MAAPVVRIEPSGPDQVWGPGAQAFADGTEHLLAELEWLRLRLYREALRLRAAGVAIEDQFRGLYVSDEQVEATLRGRGDTELPEALSLNARIAQARDDLSRRIEASLRAGLNLPLVWLGHTFSLDALERLALLMCTAVEVDLAFETLYSYVQNDVNRKRPAADLILKMSSGAPGERLRLRAAFCADGRLFRDRLIRFSGDPQHAEQSTLTRPLRTDERIVDFLLGHDRIDERLRSVAFVLEPRRALEDLQLPPGVQQDLGNAVRAFGDRGAVLFFSGPNGSGKGSAAEALSTASQRGLLVADLAEVVISPVALPEILGLLDREATLRNANLFLAHSEALSPEGGHSEQQVRTVARGLSPKGRLIFIGCEHPWVDWPADSPWPALRFEFPMPSFEQRARFWETAIRATGIDPAPGVDVAALANKYVLTGGEIRSAAGNAANRAMLRGSGAATLGMEELEAAARLQSNQGLRRLAQKVNLTHDWTDLILPPRAVQQLREVCASERYRPVVYSEWGFDSRLALGKGLNVLFCGPSGTGKTMAAGVLAREFGLDLYKIDLSSVVSKYIGETEKQLSRIFRQAQSSNAILFFDEADVLFGKRSEVKDAHDRYANVEVAYLLQKMEEYEGIVILATNFRKNMDDAFVRRMHHIVEFPSPDAEYRERIWKRLLPPAAPVADDVDFRFLARQFELAGGNIRNIVLAAAFLAAEEKRSIHMEHFILAASRELQKLGRLPSRAEFREYFELIRTRA